MHRFQHPKIRRIPNIPLKYDNVPLRQDNFSLNMDNYGFLKRYLLHRAESNVYEEDCQNGG